MWNNVTQGSETGVGGGGDGVCCEAVFQYVTRLLYLIVPIHTPVVFRMRAGGGGYLM